MCIYSHPKIHFFRVHKGHISLERIEGRRIKRPREVTQVKSNPGPINH